MYGFKHKQLHVIHENINTNPAKQPTQPIKTTIREKVDVKSSESPTQPPDQAQQEFQKTAGADKQLSRDEYTQERLKAEGYTADNKSAVERISQEFDRYAGKDGQMDEDEFLRVVTDHQTAGSTMKGADGKDLLSADQQAAFKDEKGVTNKGDLVKANQDAVNQWLQTPGGKDWAAANPKLVTKTDGKDGPTFGIKADGKEGPVTRAAMQGMEADRKKASDAGQKTADLAKTTPAVSSAETPVQPPADEMKAAEDKINARANVSPEQFVKDLDTMSGAEKLASWKRWKDDPNVSADTKLAMVESLGKSNPEMVSGDMFKQFGSDSDWAVNKFVNSLPPDKQAVELSKLPYQTRKTMVDETMDGWWVTNGENSDASAGRALSQSMVKQYPDRMDDVLSVVKETNGWRDEFREQLAPTRDAATKQLREDRDKQLAAK